VHSTLSIAVLKSTDTSANVRRFKKLLRLLESRDNPVWLSMKLKSSAGKDADIPVAGAIPVCRIFN
jgi:hypothetical protein